MYVPQVIKLQETTEAVSVYTTRALAVAAIDAGTHTEGDGATIRVGDIVWKKSTGATDISDMPDWIPLAPAYPEHFGAAGDGSTDDTAAIVAWLSYGGSLRSKSATYLIDAAGADAGGAYATLTRSTYVECDATTTFKAGTNLDNDLIRITASGTGYSATRNWQLRWRGGRFDQRLQKNSTSMPHTANYPAANLGTSATCTALSINGEVDNGGTPAPGLFRATVSNVQILASDTHWESAGGDDGIFIGGARHIEVSGVQAHGSRDLAIYCSGLTSGAITGGSCIIHDNKFYNCMYGASSKRLVSNVVMHSNVGYNTAVVCTSTDVTTTGDNVLIYGNVGYGAWNVVRCVGGTAANVYGNQSYKHGHLLEDGSAPATVFHNSNACVRFEGVTKGAAHGNRVVSLNTGVTAATSAVRLSTSCSGCEVHSNSADGVTSIVIEDASGGDNTNCWRNFGKNLTGVEVNLTGASSLDRDGPLYENNAITTHTGTTTITTVDTATIKGGWLGRRDTVHIHASGTITGTAGAKTFWLNFGGSDRQFTALSAGTSGQWMIDAYIVFNTQTSQRAMGTLIVADGSAAAVAAKETADFSSDVSLLLRVTLGNSADSVSIDTFTVRAA